MNSAWLRAISAAALLLIGGQAFAAILTTQIDGIDDSLKPAVVSAAEITSYEKKDVTPAQAQRLYTNASAQIGRALEAYGFYNANSDGELKETPQGYTAIIHVHMGDPTKVATFDLDVPSPARDETLVAKALADFAPKAGAIFDQTAYEKSKAAVQSALFAMGYLDARLVVHRAEVTRSTNRVAVSLKWATGARYRFGAVHFKDSQFDEGFLDRYIPWHEGDFYNQSKLLQLQQKLIDADYFAIVDVMPNKEQAHDGVIPIEISLAPAKRTIYTAGVFVDSDVGVGIKGSVKRRWINAHGHKLKVEAEIAQKEKSLSTTYTIPMPGANNRSFNFGAIYNDINTTTVQSRTFRFVANEQQQWLGFTRTLGINYLTGNFTVAAIDGSSSMLYPELTLSRKHADDSNFVRDGYSITLDAKASPGLASDTKFAQVRGDMKWIHALANNQRLILRGTLGMTSVDNFDDLAPELRFFAGGNNSIRGYAYQTIGPPLSPALVPIANANCARNSSLDCSNLIIGGKNLVVASAEYEYYFTPTWGIATFIDTGDAFNSFNSYQNRIGTGVGVRYRSPVGMIRADIGVPVNDPTGRTGVQLHLVIGPDL